MGTTETGTNNNIKIFNEPYRITSIVEKAKDEKMQDVLCCRKQMYEKTDEYINSNNKIISYIEAIRELNKNNNPKDMNEVTNKLQDEIYNHEVNNFDAGYRAGMTDLLIAMTFNELNITDAKVMNIGHK